MKKLILFCALIMASLVCHPSRAQQAGIKTNLLYDATTTFNLGAEFRLGGRTSLDVPLNWNPFTFSENRKWKHFLVQPEFRFWLGETFSGYFFGVHAHYAYFNVGNLPKPFAQYARDHRFEGWLAGAGISYGYRWNLSQHWGVEATIGVGYAYMNYDKFACNRCGESLDSETNHYFGPTRAGISLIYNIGEKKQPITIQAQTPASEWVPFPIPDPDPDPVLVSVPAPVPAPEPIPIIASQEDPSPVAVFRYIPQFAVSYVVPESEAVKVRSESGKAYLDFAAGQSEIVPDFKNNAAELEKIYSLIREVRRNPDATITGITIAGYASPEGTYASNLSLSERRAVSLKNQIKMVTGYPDGFFSVEGMGEDWETLDALVSQSDMTEKYAILEIIRGTDVFDGREKKLMMLSGGNPYRRMKAELFPQLRRTEYQLHYTVVPFTVEKGKEVFKSYPSSLSLNEMFLIANTYTPGSDEFNEIFETAARIFPHEDAANLNAAAIVLRRGDAVQAEIYLSKVRVQSAAYHNNMGVLYGLREEWERAAESFRQSRSMGSAEARINEAEIGYKLGNAADAGCSGNR